MNVGQKIKLPHTKNTLCGEYDEFIGYSISERYSFVFQLVQLFHNSSSNYALCTPQDTVILAPHQIYNT